MTAMWAGRFSKEENDQVNAFNASILFDQALIEEDIQGSLAHAAMLEKQGILSPEDGAAIASGLKEILSEYKEGKLTLDLRYEDIHMAIEEILTEKIGPAGKRLHTGRSRNDQVALDLKCWTRKQLKEVQKDLLHLIEVLCTLADEQQDTIMPGYTHLQRAQPITLGHWMMAYANMFQRDLLRLDNTLSLMNTCPLGSGALAGSTFDLDRDMTAAALGFEAPCPNSLDGVSDRDYVIEALSDLSIIMMHLSRMSEEIISWCSWEFKFIELDDAFATGSSIMPQKKNPDICELIRGKTGRVYGALMQMLTVMKGLPLAYNKDMQEDKELLFDAVKTVKDCLEILPNMLQSMSVRKDNMKKAASHGFINATDMADYLTKQGLPFREAYKITGQAVAYCIENAKGLEDLSLEELKSFSDLFDEGVYEAIDLMNCLKGRITYGSPAPDSVAFQVHQMEHFLVKWKESQ